MRLNPERFMTSTLVIKMLLSWSNAIGTSTISSPIEVLGFCTCLDVEDIRDRIVSRPLADTFDDFLQSSSSSFSYPASITLGKLKDENALRYWARHAFPALVGRATARGVTVEVRSVSVVVLEVRLSSSNSTVF